MEAAAATTTMEKRQQQRRAAHTRAHTHAGIQNGKYRFYIIDTKICALKYAMQEWKMRDLCDCAGLAGGEVWQAGRPSVSLLAGTTKQIRVINTERERERERGRGSGTQTELGAALWVFLNAPAGTADAGAGLGWGSAGRPSECDRKAKLTIMMMTTKAAAAATTTTTTTTAATKE